MTQQEFQQRYTYNPDTDRLGKGGLDEVFRAYDTVRDSIVAIKVSKVKPELDSICLRKEEEMVNCLPEHPNIAFYEACYTFHEMSGEYDFGIMPYYEEGNLRQLLKNKTLTLSQKQSLLSQILDGLEFLHAQGIIHRDLKPQNILIVQQQNSEYIPKITDFGISKKPDINSGTVFGNSLAEAGALAYASPEQQSEREIRKNTDLWSFGVIASQTLTGKLPFTTDEHISASEAEHAELFRQINSGKLPEEIDTIPEPWQTVIRKCLIVDPAQRIKNTQEAKDILAGAGRVGAPLKPAELLKPFKPFVDFILKPDNKPFLLAAAVIAIVLLLNIGWRALNRIGKSMAKVVEPEMVFVQGGTFTMGCTSEQGVDCRDWEKPAHQVTLSDFYIGKYEVTQAQWKAIIGNNPSSLKGDNLPVENVCWNDVQEFIRKLNAQSPIQYRLPTEAEWEYACKGGLRSARYKYSGSNDSNEVAWSYENSNTGAHPVGTKRANELGIYDMSGNVWEWCNDWLGDFSESAQTNPHGPSSGSYRVHRGGGWDHDARFVRVSYRSYCKPDDRDSALGFRLACNLK